MLDAVATPSVDPASTALVIVDMQNDFCHLDGYYARQGRDVSGLAAVIAPTAELLRRTRASGMTVAYTRLVHDPAQGAWSSATATCHCAGRPASVWRPARAPRRGCATSSPPRRSKLPTSSHWSSSREKDDIFDPLVASNPVGSPICDGIPRYERYDHAWCQLPAQLVISHGASA